MVFILTTRRFLGESAICYKADSEPVGFAFTLNGTAPGPTVKLGIINNMDEDMTRREFVRENFVRAVGLATASGLADTSSRGSGSFLRFCQPVGNDVRPCLAGARVLVKPASGLADRGWSAGMCPGRGRS